MTSMKIRSINASEWITGVMVKCRVDNTTTVDKA